jgi:hypothetical protein
MSQVLQDFCKMTFYIQNVTVYTLFVLKLKFQAKYVCIQGLILRFKRDIDKNYAVVKRFPTLSNWVYLYLSAMSTRLDEIVKDYDCFKGSPEACPPVSV